MLFGWEGFFGQDQATQDLVNESTIIHFTCIEQSLKTYFGYYFGGFGDMDHYYSDPPPLLGTANISGMIDAVHAQVAFAAQLAHKMRRTFKTVYLDAHASISTLEEEISKLSLMQVVILDFANFSPPIYNATWEEWKREENNAEQGEQREGEGNETEEKETDPRAEKLRWLKEKEEEWFGDTFEGGGYKDFSQHFLDRLKKCKNANAGNFCLDNCGA